MFKRALFLTPLFVMVFSFSWQNLSWGYGAIVVDRAGKPVKFQSLANGETLKWNPETGPVETDEMAKFFGDLNATCNSGGGGGCSLSPWLREAQAQNITITNQEGIDMVTHALGQWQAVTEANVHFAQGDSLGEDVTVCNVDKFIDTPDNHFSGLGDPRICGCETPVPSGCQGTCQNPIIFDPNGDIVERLLGPGNRVGTLAVTGPLPDDPVNPTRYLRFSMVVNGFCLSNSPDPACQGFTIDKQDLQSVMTHELGHGIGLDHTQVNPSSVVFTSGGAQLASGADPESIPTMFPFLVLNASVQQDTLHKDDKAALAHLYPASNFGSTHCTISGTVFDNKNINKTFACAEVVVRQKGSPNSTSEAIGFISGSEVANVYNQDTTQNGCTATSPVPGDCGDFTIQGLIPNTAYVIEVNPINPKFVEGSSINPCTSAPPQFPAVGAADLAGSLNGGASTTIGTTCGGGGTVTKVSLSVTPP